MKKITVPYAGGDKYVFVSYCHKDEKRVYPVVSELMNEGCRIWYDAGINPGLEWPEVIAEHLSGCTACVAFVSEASLRSHNCRKEINFALMKNKPLLIVMLDDAKLSPGMEMQLSTVQSVLAYRSGTDVVSSVRSFGALSDCFGDADGDEAYADEDNNMKKSPAAERSAAAEKRLYLERIPGGQCVSWKGVLTVGRSTDCGYPLIGISAVSSRHGELSQEEQRLYVTDLGSTNGTFVNGKKIVPGQKQELACGDEVGFASEKFIVRSGCFERCERLVIEEIRNGRIHFFDADAPIVIGSASDKCTLTLTENKHISREHLRVEAEGKEIFITDLNSINGSYIQGEKLAAGEKRLLRFAVTVADEPLYIAFEPDRTEG